MATLLYGFHLIIQLSLFLSKVYYSFKTLLKLNKWRFPISPLCSYCLRGTFGRKGGKQTYLFFLIFLIFPYLPTVYMLINQFSCLFHLFSILIYKYKAISYFIIVSLGQLYRWRHYDDVATPKQKISSSPLLVSLSYFSETTYIDLLYSFKS